MNRGSSGRRIASLDGLRAFSILLVFVGHLAGTRHFLAHATVARAGDLGNLGVRIFFVISGFLITGLLLAERTKTGRISLKAFYMRRVLRIFPAFYAYIGIVGLLTLFGVVANDRRDFLHALTYTVNYQVSSEHFSLRHLWSLAVEEQFYFAWPLTLAVLGRRRALAVLAAVMAFVPVLRVALYHLVPGYELYAMTGFESVCDALATGALLAIVLPRLRTQPAFARVLASPLLIALFVVVLVANLQSDHPHLFWFVCIPVMNVSIALLVARYVEHPDLPLGRVLNARAAAAIGVVSYSLYLWQQLFLIQWRPPASVWQEFPLNVIAAAACGVASYKLVEQPFLRLKSRFEPVRTGERLAAPAEPAVHAGSAPVIYPQSPSPA